MISISWAGWRMEEVRRKTSARSPPLPVRSEKAIAEEAVEETALVKKASMAAVEVTAPSEVSAS
jgi:hypothetical protein